MRNITRPQACPFDVASLPPDSGGISRIRRQPVGGAGSGCLVEDRPGCSPLRSPPRNVRHGWRDGLRRKCDAL